MKSITCQHGKYTTRKPLLVWVKVFSKGYFRFVIGTALFKIQYFCCLLYLVCQCSQCNVSCSWRLFISLSSQIWKRNWLRWPSGMSESDILTVNQLTMNSRPTAYDIFCGHFSFHQMFVLMANGQRMGEGGWLLVFRSDVCFATHLLSRLCWHPLTSKNTTPRCLCVALRVPNWLSLHLHYT